MAQIASLQGIQSKSSRLQLLRVSDEPALLHDGLVDGRVMLFAAPHEPMPLSITAKRLERTGLPEQSDVVQRSLKEVGKFQQRAYSVRHSAVGVSRLSSATTNFQLTQPRCVSIPVPIGDAVE